MWLTAMAQPLCHVTYYDEEDGLPHSHVTQLLQDQQGLMWFSTWNGLCRYDGYEFRTFKPQAGDGCNMATDRIRMFVQRPDGNFICRIDDDYFLFDTHTYRFCNLSQEGAEDDMNRYRTSMSLKEDKPIVWKDAFRTRWKLYADGHLTWEAVPYAICYVVTKNGEVAGFTKETTFEGYTEGDTWQVQAVNENGGLSQKAAANAATGIVQSSKFKVQGSKFYTLDGCQVSGPRHGLNIVRMSDGTIRKVMVK